MGHEEIQKGFAVSGALPPNTGINLPKCSAVQGQLNRLYYDDLFCPVSASSMTAVSVGSTYQAQE